MRGTTARRRAATPAAATRTAATAPTPATATRTAPTPAPATRTAATRTAGLVAAAALVLAFGGCQSTPRVTNGSVSVCYRAIPVGRKALNDRAARLIGVHRVPVESVRNHLPKSAQDQLAAEDDTKVCEMSFEGDFQPGQVRMAPTDESGSYALVLVSSKHLHLVGSVVLKQLPRAFGGRTL